jgi:hypothetical protein
METRRIADLTAGEQVALRTLSLAVYPPEVAAAWPGRAVESALRATVGERGWVGLAEPIIVRAGEAFTAVPEPPTR